MGLPAVSSTFRFSSRQHSLALVSRQPTPATYSSWRSSKRMFLRSAILQNKFSNPDASGHPESAARTRPDDNGSHSSCLCCGQRKLMNVDYDQGASRSPLADATLTALMGMGIAFVGGVAYYAWYKKNVLDKVLSIYFETFEARRYSDRTSIPRRLRSFAGISRACKAFAQKSA